VKQSAVLEGALRHFRSRRMRMFEKTFALTPRTRVLDVGGSSKIWDFVTVRPRLTIVNLPSAVDAERRDEDHVAADGCLLPFRDGSFDVVFSNSVIEHVGSVVNQQRFAAEIARVGRYYWVQTPNRNAPFEMHVMLPFVHLLPKRWQFTIIRTFTPWELLARPTEDQKEHFYNHVVQDLRLLDDEELQSLFPGAQIINERVLGLPKSLLAVRA
jgi:Methyltransferase domain